VFQFLGRNSGRSDFACFLPLAIFSHVFQFLGRNSGRSDNAGATEDVMLQKVSIPRSEFWSFGLYPQTPSSSPHSRFQFLGRNSGRSDALITTSKGGRSPKFQFLGRNSGRSDFWISTGRAGTARFQFLGRNSGRSDLSAAWEASKDTESFNSSVGILVVRTIKRLSLDCDLTKVSIPRSEFWSFGLQSAAFHGPVFIEFQFLGRNSGRSDNSRAKLTKR